MNVTKELVFARAVFDFYSGLNTVLTVVTKDGEEGCEGGVGLGGFRACFSSAPCQISYSYLSLKKEDWYV